MARSSLGLPHLLLIAGLAAAGFFIYNRIEQPERGRGHWPERRQERHAGRRQEFRERGPFSAQREQAPAACDQLGVACATRYFHSWTEPAAHSCRAKTRDGYPVPDPRCTPGGVNPSVSAEVLRDPRWRTGCVRNCANSEAEKHVTYSWYGIRKPRGNSGENQVCELDHLVPLELGGTDSLGNLWPECGPDSVTLRNRYFKIKDRVENYLADEVKAGRMPLDRAQRGIAENWTQYLGAANRYCEAGGRC